MTRKNILSDKTKCNVFIAESAINDLKIDEDEGWYVRNSIGGCYRVILVEISGNTFTFKVTNRYHEQYWELKRDELPDSLFKRQDVQYSQIYWATTECIASKSLLDLKNTFEVFFRGFDQGLQEWFLRFYERNKIKINRLSPKEVLSHLAIPMQ